MWRIYFNNIGVTQETEDWNQPGLRKDWNRNAKSSSSRVSLSTYLIAASHGSLFALLFVFSWHSSPLWYSICMACCHPPQVQRLLLYVPIPDSWRRDSGPIWTRGAYLVWSTEATGRALWAAHTLPKDIAITNMKFFNQLDLYYIIWHYVITL